MKYFLLFVSIIIVANFSFAGKKYRNFTEVPVCEVQYISPDSLLLADTLQNTNPARWTLQTSPYLGDTITVVGMCLAPAKTITYTASGFTLLLADTSASGIMKPWCGLLVRCNTADSGQAILDGILNIQKGDIVKVTGFVSEFPNNPTSMNSASQFQPIPGIAFEIIGSGDVPKPHPVSVGDFYTGLFPNGTVRYSTGEQYEGVYVEMTNLTVNARVNTSRGTFSVVDAVGNSISDYDASHFFTLGHGNPPIPGDPSYTTLWNKIQVGTLIDTLRGFITVASGQENQRGYRICPTFIGDVVVGVVKAQVYSHRRYPVIVPSDSAPRVNVTVKEGENTIASVKLFYRTNGGNFSELPMSTISGDTTYEAAIPMQTAGTWVDYFVEVKDDADYVSILSSAASDGSQSDTSKGYFFYKVNNGALSIRDIQYTPYVNGRSAYVGAVTTVSGFVTADTANLMLTALTTGGTSAWYIQDSSAMWNGMWIVGPESLLASVKNNDNITVTGSIQESNDVTRIAFVSSVTVNSTGNPKRIPIKLKTGRFGPTVGNGNTDAEPYEGVLVQFDSVTVTNVYPTFADITEYEINDGTGPILVRRDGTNKYSNVEADTIFGMHILHQGDKIQSLVGVMYFSFRRYKITPRTNSDITGVTGIVERTDVVPTAFSLSQNYPNPFNPTTSFSYALASPSLVTLKVFNILGEEIATLVNGFQEVGSYNISFDAAKLASGVYFYRLTAGEYSATKKMLLMK